MTIAPQLVVSDSEMTVICQRYHVRELSIFGSAARGELKPNSDVDLLVDFEPQARIGLLELAGLIEDLSALIGRPVDVAVKPALKPLVRSEVLADARVLYAA